MKQAILLLNFIVIIHFSLIAQPGSLDIAFCTGGITTTKVDSFAESFARSVAIQSDGKIIVAGYKGNSPTQDFALVRYKTNGTPDSSFGTNGIVTTDFGGDDVGYSVAIQSDGKIIVAGYNRNNDYYFTALARYNLNGTLDNTFGTGGKVTTNTINTADEQGFSVAIQTDGKIIVGGVSDGLLAAFRYNSDGSLDNTFGTGGKWTTTDETGTINFIALQNNGKIVMTGYYNGGDFILIRLNNNGSLDANFSGGIIINDLGNNNVDISYSLVIQNDGKLIVGGTSSTDTTIDIGLIRYNSDGSLDNSFGTNGIVVTDFGGNDEANSVLWQADGKIVVSGYTDKGGFGHYDALARYNANGTLDDTFGNNGILSIWRGFYTEYAYASTLQTDGKILVAGYSNGDFSLVRLMNDGAFDNTFAPDGRVITPSIGTAKTVGIQSDGKIVVGGYTVFAPSDYELVRYNTDGTIDKMFGTKGIVTTNFNSYGGLSHDEVHSMAFQPDGKILLAGRTINSDFNHNYSVARYNTDGTLDTSFGGVGKITIDHASTEDGRSIVVQSDGKIVIGGVIEFWGSGTKFYLVRLFSNGDLESDNTFANCQVNFGNNYDEAYSLALQADGKIVMGGFALGFGGDNDFALLRIKTNGFPDSTFGTNGTITTDFETGNDKCYSVKIQSDGKIIAAGSTNGNFALVRYNTDGNLDSLFGTDGKVITDFGGEDNGYSVELQADGKILVGGTQNENGFNSQFGLVRYNSDGSLDNTFGANGFAPALNFDKFDQILNDCHAIAIQADGKIVMAGTSGVGIGVGQESSFVLARFNGDNGGIGIKEKADAGFFDKIKIYPNPASSLLYVDLNRVHADEFVITNILGQQVFKTTETKTERLTIDVKDKWKGIYIYQVIKDKRVVSTGKLIIQ